MHTNITIHEGVATLESGEQSKSVAFFASLSEEERNDILEAARLALADNDCLDRMDMADEFAAPLQMKIEKFMK
jgi:cell division inhibitor SulA